MNQPKNITALNETSADDVEVYYESIEVGDLAFRFQQTEEGSIECTQAITGEDGMQQASSNGQHSVVGGDFAEVIAKYLDDARNHAERHLADAKPR